MAQTFVSIGGEIINGKFIKNVVELGDSLALEATEGIEIVTDDPAEVGYLKAYMEAHNFFKLGPIYYNPDHVVRVYIGDEANHGYVMDSDGDEEAHTSLDEVQQLLAAAPDFIWVPPEV